MELKDFDQKGLNTEDCPGEVGVQRVLQHPYCRQGFQIKKNWMKLDLICAAFNLNCSVLIERWILSRDRQKHAPFRGNPSSGVCSTWDPNRCLMITSDSRQTGAQENWEKWLKSARRSFYFVPGLRSLQPTATKPASKMEAESWKWPSPVPCHGNCTFRLAAWHVSGHSP